MRVLLVDDETDFLDMLEIFFQERGDTVSTAVNGEQAWEIIQASPTASQDASEPFDVILTDHRMPLMNGIELIKKIRQNGFDLPVVLMSGDAEAKQDDYIMKEVFELLPKPTRLSTLENVFSKIESNLV